MSQLDQINRLCDAFGGRATQSEIRFYKKTPSYPPSFADNYIDRRTEVVGAIAIHIPDHMLDDFLRMFDERKYQEMEIRLDNPAVKKAYEHYRLLLNLCKGDYDARY